MYDPKIKKLYDKDRKVWKYNLLVDGLIGPEEGCAYKNMGEYIGTLDGRLDTRLQEFEDRLVSYSD